jgi:hypothetical protein
MEAVVNLSPAYGFNGFFDSAQINALNKFYFYFILTDEDKSGYINKGELKRAKTDKDVDLVMEKAFNNWEKKGNTPLYDFNANKDGLSFDDFGQPGYPLQNLIDVKETMNMSGEETYRYINKWNSVTEKSFTDDEKNLLLLSALMQASAGFLPKEVSDVGKRIKSGIVYKSDGKGKKKKFTFEGDRVSDQSDRGQRVSDSGRGARVSDDTDRGERVSN